MAYNRVEIAEEEIEKQRKYMAEIRDMWHAIGRVPLACIDTYGCQQNEADSEKIRGMLSQMGYDFTDDTHEADVIVMNTCAVREHAEQRVFGNVGALTHTKRAKPDQIIVMVRLHGTAADSCRENTPIFPSCGHCVRTTCAVQISRVFT